MHFLPAFLSCLTTAALLACRLPALAESGPLGSAVTRADLEAASYAEWVDGKEKPVDTKTSVEDVVWVTPPKKGRGVVFGESKTPGVRHLRIGFTKAMAVGSVLVEGGGVLSVLKAGSAAPGVLDDETAWLPAERITAQTVDKSPVEEFAYALWVLPPGTQTRALRFTHDASPAEGKSYAGKLGGLVVLRERWTNLAPQAVVSAGHNGHKAASIINEIDDRFDRAWDNAGPSLGEIVSPVHPETVTLSWPEAVTLRGLNALFAGFSAAEVQAYQGPADSHPAEAGDAAWAPVAKFENIEHHYGRALRSHWLDFGREVTTRAIRLRITKAGLESTPGLKGRLNEGRHVWLGEIFAMKSLGDAPLASVVSASPREESHPPIPIRFSLQEPGLVTLVIEDTKGNRVRNLLAETPFPAGDNTAWWDGMDDLGRDEEAARHGVYHVPGKLVAPGEYRVRGLALKGTELRYEFAVYNEGIPPWPTADNTGCWMTNHTPPTSAAFVPGSKTADGKPLVYLGARISEGGHGLQWVELNGKKRGGVGRVGGTWTGGATLACDFGAKAEAGVQLYVGAVHDGELRLSAMAGDAGRDVLKIQLGEDSRESNAPMLTGFEAGDRNFVLGGLGARDGLLVCSLTRQNQLLFATVSPARELGRVSIRDPRGMWFDREGRLLVLSGKELRRYAISGLPDAPKLDAGTAIVSSGLEDPRQVTQDTTGNFYISDRGNSHQVKVFSPAGKLLSAIGRAGVPQAGPYDPLHMNNPNGLTIDEQGQLWVAEADYQPKRISVWTAADGKLVRAYYGPSRYGGGGKLDPQDKTRFYYEGMEFRLDWAKASWQLTSVLWRPAPNEAPSPQRNQGRPEEPIYVAGRRYFTNCYNSNPTSGAGFALLWQDRGGIARPVAACGRAELWALLQTPPFLSRWPKDVDPADETKRNAVFASWMDANGDGQTQPAEVTIRKSDVGGVTVMPDCSFVVTRLEGRTMRFAPRGFNVQGVPTYDFAAGTVLAANVQRPKSSGGDQALAHPSGWTMLTVAPKPFEQASICGVYKGEPRWSYPSPWPGLHASHGAPVGEPGQLVGTTRLLGNFVVPRGEGGPLWFINGNMGNIYVFTIDGLFVRTLFQDVRIGRPWRMPSAERNMLLNDVAPHDENFWPSVTQTADGAVYVVDGFRTSLVRVDGLDSIRRLPAQTLRLDTATLAAAQAWQVQSEAARQRKHGLAALTVALRASAPAMDGKLDDWSSAQWAPIDKRGVKAYFGGNSKPYDVDGAVAIAGERLYAAFRTGDEKLLRNSGEQINAPFKTGGALDLMLGADSAADPKRAAAAPGDVRLLVTLVKNKPLALLYRANVPGTTPLRRIPFSSPTRTIYFDRVDDVSAQIEFAGTGGNFELSIPLATLGLRAAPGATIKGDIGILRGDGSETTQRVYWANKATGITADVPSEAMLTPELWGRWQFETAR